MMNHHLYTGSMPDGSPVHTWVYTRAAVHDSVFIVVVKEDGRWLVQRAYYLHWDNAVTYAEEQRSQPRVVKCYRHPQPERLRTFKRILSI